MVFERFLYVALGEALGLGEDRWKSEKSLNLDTQGRIKMEPDLSWWPPGLNVGISLPCFVGDAKYKRLDEPGFGTRTSIRCSPTARRQTCPQDC